MNDKTYSKISKCFLLLTAVILYCTFVLYSQDNDMYFEIASGRDILNGNFYTVSHLGNYPIVIQQWLYAACLALVDKLGTIGHFGFVVLQDAILIALSSIFIYEKTKNRPNARRNSIIVSFFAVIFCFEYMINIRPQIITMIFLVAELILLEKYRTSETIVKKRNVTYLIAIIPLLILSANFHQAVFLYHILILIPYYIDICYMKLRKKDSNAEFNTLKIIIDWKVVLFTPLYLACSLVTPYGLDGSLYVLKTLTSDVFKIIPIQEIKPVTLTSLLGIKVMILAIIGIIFLVSQFKNSGTLTKYHSLFYIALLFILAFSNARHMSISFIAVIFILAEINYSVLKKPFIYFGMSLICFIFSMILLLNFTWLENSYGDIAAVIEDHDAKIFNTAIDTGGWLEYNGYTNVYMDSRCEAFSSDISGVEDRITDIGIVQNGFINKEFVTADDILNVIDDYDYLVTYRTDYINRVCNWEIIYEDDTYIIRAH